MENSSTTCGCVLAFSFLLVAACAGTQPVAAPVPGAFLDVGGAKLWYEECSPAPVAGSVSITGVVLLHDGLVHSITWDGVWPAFCAKYPVVRYDRRGYGRCELRNPLSSQSTTSSRSCATCTWIAPSSWEILPEADGLWTLPSPIRPWWKLYSFEVGKDTGHLIQIQRPVTLASRFNAFVALAEPKEAAANDDQLAAYVGPYELFKRPATVSLRDHRLVVEFPGDPYYWLFAASETGFFLQTDGAEIEFHKAADGKVSEIAIYNADGSVVRGHVLMLLPPPKSRVPHPRPCVFCRDRVQILTFSPPTELSRKSISPHCRKARDKDGPPRAMISRVPA